MLDSLHQFLYDARLFVCFVTVPVGLYSAWRCFTAITAPVDDTGAPGARTTRRMPSRPPGAPPTKPVQQLISDKPAGSPSSVEAGKESRLNKALASTIRIDTGDARHTTGADAATVKPAESKPAIADEVNQLFAGLDDKLQPSAEAPRPKLTPAERSADALAKAGRLEQLGFHHPTPKDGTRVRAVSDPSKPTEAAKGPELDDILAKLDKVLGEKPADKPAPPAAAPVPPATAPTAPKAPLWARADATDEDAEAKPDPGKQLGLFEEGKDKDKPAG